MEEAYKQYANQARRKNRSSTNLNHLSLAPFTSRMPLQDDDALPDHLTSPHHSTSYLEGKSAPTTPGLLTRSPARSNSHARRASVPHADLPKSKSATHLTPAADRKSRSRKAVSGTTSPTVRRRKDDFSIRDRNDSDWLLRTGALISNENRESKGQAWLVSRQSSTSLTGMRDADEEAFERELARERELTSRRSSRRGSLADLEGAGYIHSARPSRPGSRSASRVGGTRSQILTPMERERHSLEEGYFPRHHDGEDYIPGPDFVNLDEQLESFDFDTTQDDEAAVRRLVKGERAGGASWVGNILGWPLFAVEENEEESDDEDDVDGDEFEGEADEDGAHGLHRSWSARQFESVIGAPEERIPPPKANEGGWQDAAWLLSVATKILL